MNFKWKYKLPKETNHPTIVAGDLKDVGWSSTSKLFRKYSGLVDPREGRGLYNTYSVSLPLLRYPLDIIFYSREFGLLTLKKPEDIGSDHFPLLIGLSYEPNDDNTEGLEKTNAGRYLQYYQHPANLKLYSYQWTFTEITLADNRLNFLYHGKK